MKRNLRSDCPIAASLDILGDRWTMLILRDMLLAGKSQFGEFATDEGVATNILADRLTTLVERGIIEKVPDETDRRKFHYRLLPPGVELLPVIAELVVWGVRHTEVPPSAQFESVLNPETRAEFLRERTEQLLAQV
jgi:DNA-binding HxlR family transcriptional regulator